MIERAFKQYEEKLQKTKTIFNFKPFKQKFSLFQENFDCKSLVFKGRDKIISTP